MNDAMILSGVSKRYGDFQLDGVNLRLERGSIMGFIGENGAGKSTTIHAILGLIRPDGGEITLLGERGGEHAQRELRERLGVVLDEACFPELLCLRDVQSVVSKLYRTWNERRFSELCKRFALPERKMIKEYSKGMKTKLMIAVALSHATELLILDEATSGLDPIVRDEVLELFLEFTEDPNHAIFMSSHILSDLEKACDYIAFLHRGKLMFCEPKDELTENFAVLKCSKEQFAQLDRGRIYGSRENRFGVEALVKREEFRGTGLLLDPASIEDIMLYTGKER